MPHTRFKASKQNGSEVEAFLIFCIYFYGFNPEPPRRDHFGTNFVEDHLPMIHTKFQDSEASGSEGEDF